MVTLSGSDPGPTLIQLFRPERRVPVEIFAMLQRLTEACSAA
jgi:hypothetical protein